MKNALWLLVLLYAGSVFAKNTIMSRVMLNDELETIGWAVEDGTLLLEMKPREPLPMRGFFEGRGLSSKLAQELSEHCIFQLHMRNIGDVKANAELLNNMDEWRVMTVKTTRAPIMRPEWLTRWKDETISSSAHVAFRWFTFPNPQNFFPGDYNVGIATFGPARGEYFDLEIHWTMNSIAKQHLIKNMSCL